jgi:hypothetical protein
MGSSLLVEGADYQGYLALSAIFFSKFCKLGEKKVAENGDAIIFCSRDAIYDL